MRARDNRIARLRRTIEASPIRRHVLEQAYGWFTELGELPEDDHVAFEVVQRARRGGEEEPPEDKAEVANKMQAARLAYQRHERHLQAWPPTVRAMLFDEALFEREPLRGLARLVIAKEVAYGGDVESSGFGARHGIPMHRSVAMHLTGFPMNCVKPPYERQANELFVRFDNIRARTPFGDDDWFKEQTQAVLTFKQTGVLPADDLHFEAVLAKVELDQLIAHSEGKKVAKAMRLFRDVAWCDGKKQERALQKLCELARAGQLH